MALQPFEDHNGAEWYALWSGIAVTIVGATWKFFLGARSDLRSDRKAEVVNGTYEGTVKMLRDQLELEIARRLELEAENIRLRMEVAKLRNGAP